MSQRSQEKITFPENASSYESDSHSGPENAPNSLNHVMSSKPPLQAPNQKHQHMSLLFLGLIEGRCKQEALDTLNEQRDVDEKLCETDPEVHELSMHMYDEMVQNLKQNGMIPMPQYAGLEGAPHREKYLGGFDAVLGSIAKKKLQTLGSDENSSSTGSPMHGNSLNNALAIPVAHSSRTRVNRGSSAHELMLGETQDLFSEKSQYAEEYVEERFLGKGGYGKVVQVRSILDDCQYAVKSILISSQRLQKFQDMAQIEALLMELRTLAKLNHTNIVRYYHGWIERYSARPAVVSNRQRLLEAGETQTSSMVSDSMSESEHSVDISDTFNGSVGLGIQPMSDHFRGEGGDADDGIVFGYSSISQAIEDVQPERKRKISQATTSSAMTLKTSIESVGETELEKADDVESIPRNNMQGNVWTTAESSPAVVPPRQTKLHDQYLYIKMSLHPMTLQKYLSSETPKPTEDFPIRHCYHTNAAVKILLAILDGIDYLHSQRIVHRDLKPANIFLSVTEGRCPSLTGSVNIKSCSECLTSTRGGDIYLTPCIGDFGLIAEIKDEPVPSSDQTTFKLSPLATLSPKPVGTQFYRPSVMPKTEPYICEKLDVFSLGVMAFELVNKFTTGFERVDLLGKLNKGNLPLWFENHPFALGVEGMTRLDRDQRWNCKKVRDWLEELLTDN